MCGISGILLFNNQQVTSSRLQAMNDSLSHRGPDGQALWISENASIGFAHRRLSIIDLSERGAQPMHYLGRYTIVFNGEIYNYIEIKKELEKLGYRFNSNSDTEVLLAAYDKYGVEMLKYLDGMFAFALWDEKERKLFCARDRFGEKPFYYSYSGGQFIFGSEMKALFKGGVERQVNRHMLFNFLVFHSENSPLTAQKLFLRI